MKERRTDAEIERELFRNDNCENGIAPRTDAERELAKLRAEIAELKSNLRALLGLAILCVSAVVIKHFVGTGTLAYCLTAFGGMGIAYVGSGLTMRWFEAASRRQRENPWR